LDKKAKINIIILDDKKNIVFSILLWALNHCHSDSGKSMI